MEDVAVNRRRAVVSLLALMLLFISLGVAAAPTIHSADVLSANNDYCHYCHLDSDAPDPSMPTIWRGEEQGTLCLSCHNPTGLAAAKSDVALHRVNNGALIVDCSSCHNPHGTDETYSPDSKTWSVDPHPGGVTAPNRDHIRSKTTSYVRDVLGIQRLEPTVFQQRPAHFAFGETQAPWNGICQTCHQNTAHHTNNANADHEHNLGLVCTECHPHKEGFLPHGAGDCSYCHNVPRGDNGDGTFRRRQIFDAGGDFMKASHHVKSNIQPSDCATCHYLQDHARGVVKLQDQDDANLHYDYDPANPAGMEPFCLSCHDADGATIGGGTRPFSDGVTVPDVKGTVGSEWANAAHKTRGYADNGGNPLTCLGDGTGGGCHANGHASDNEKLLSLPSGASINQLCFNCHTDGKVVNDAISGSALASSIEGAFNLSAVHNLQTGFQGGSYTFTLQCTTCHNPHVVTGKYTDAATGHSPVTRPDFSRSPADNPRAMGSSLWGAATGQKAQDYASTATPYTGTYRTPNGEAFDGTELPDYNSMCLDCHAEGAMPAPTMGGNPDDHGGVKWAGDPHGLKAANRPHKGANGLTEWPPIAKALGWESDDCVGAETDCWPVVPIGLADDLWTLPPFNHSERIVGANFVLQCVNCHEAHGSTNRSMLRTNPNGGSVQIDPNAGTTAADWLNLCTNCHFIRSPWHHLATTGSSLGCGDSSCHVGNRMIFTGTNTLHEMMTYPGHDETRTFDPTLLADLQFEDNLEDSGSWGMDAYWYAHLNGTFENGRNGKAVRLYGDQTIELGTRDAFSSTDETRHATWQYTEMKYHGTLEAWIEPTEDTESEYVIFTKNASHLLGGYRFTLERRNQGLILVFRVNVDGTAGGVRGAYSRVPVVLNRWSHVAVSFDTDGPDRSGSDPSVGRIRIYINGEDVTTSDAMGSLMQPGAGETAIFPYSSHSPANEAICPRGLCASAFSIGGEMARRESSRLGFVGMMDDVKVWNITKPASYFQAIDANTGPRIVAVSGAIGSAQLVVTFSEGVYGGSGALQVSDFSYIDADDGRTVIAVDHVAGANIATLTLSSPLDSSNDIGVDTVQVTGVDEYGNMAEATNVTIGSDGPCPIGKVVFDLNETAGSPYVQDDQNIIAGAVNNSLSALPGDGTLHGDGAANYITFDKNLTCLQTRRAMTIETRIKPTGITTAPYTTRILSRNMNAGGNYYLSVWTGNSRTYAKFTPPAGVASIALWVNPLHLNLGVVWKPVLTNYTNYPIVSDHWYRIKVVWNSDKAGGTVDQPYVPADIFIDDEGTDGLGAGENWVGYRNATNDTQSYKDSTVYLLYTGDQINAQSGAFSLAVDANDPAKGLFEGQIDWLTWEGIADYSGVDDPPN